MAESPDRLATIRTSAPIRVCDNGGWTDTWFAGHGRIFNIAVAPRVQVTIDLFPAAERPDRIVIHALNYGESYVVTSLDSHTWGPHPLLEAAIARMGIPADLAVEITIGSDAPAGAAIGTSAAVCVALIAALDALTPGRLTAHQVAFEAQAVETEMLGQQSGIQDQLAAAYGGVNLIEMSAYPKAEVTQIPLADDRQQALNERLLLLYLGLPHRSSDVHEMVIRELEDLGPDNPKIDALRQTAAPSAAAIAAADWASLGRLMTANTEAQRALHPQLISPTADHVMTLAARFGMLGCKVNGAGGSGGSVTILGDGHPERQHRFLRELKHRLPQVANIPIRFCPKGLRLSIS